MAFSRNTPSLYTQLLPAVRSLTVNATKTLAQAFISCRLDYCNSLLYGISDGLLQRLQSVQNAAALLVTGARRCDHNTQCHDSCTGCQSVSESCLRSRGSCISRSLERLPRTLLTTVALCRTLVVAHCGLIQITRGTCSCREHITNLVIGVSRRPVLECGTTFHPDYGGRDSPSVSSDDL